MQGAKQTTSCRLENHYHWRKHACARTANWRRQ